MSRKRAWYGRPNNPPENWDTPDKPAIRKVSSVESPPDHLFEEFSITLTNENWIAMLKCLALYYEDDPQPSGNVWRQRIRETVLSAVSVEANPKRKTQIQLRRADLNEIIRQVHIVCAERGDAWSSWASHLEHALSIEE